jgi:protein gp37
MPMSSSELVILNDRALAQFQQGRNAIAKARDAGDVFDLKKMHDCTAALARVLKQRDEYRELAQEMAAQQLLSEHAIGEILRRTVRHEGGRPKKHRNGSGVLETAIPHGISQDQSRTWQKVAAIPLPRLEKYIAECAEKEEPPSRMGAMRNGPATEGGAAQPTSLARESTFNRQGNDSIEWAQWSWNPVTGCLHNCPYCYARDIANRLYPQKFEPTFHPERLNAPHHTKFPQKEIDALPSDDPHRLGLKNVFVCSMADLFGRWVPAEWIEKILEQVRAATQWNFLFLTKFPIRMAEFDFPDNAWVGTTVDCQARVANAEKAFRKVKAGVKWLSLEPLLEPLKFKDLGAFDWIVLGGASPSTQTPEWHPPREWVRDIKEEADRLGVSFYEKTNLHGRIRGYPGQPGKEPSRAPDCLRYLPTDEK